MNLSIHLMFNIISIGSIETIGSNCGPNQLGAAFLGTTPEADRRSAGETGPLFFYSKDNTSG
jgi:hypothetical protein